MTAHASFIHQPASFRVVIHTPDVVGERMAGPGIRAWHLASELAKHFPTTLIAKSETPVASRVAGGELRVARPFQHEGSGTGNAQRATLDFTAAGSLSILEHGSTAARVAMREAAVLIGQPARGFRKRRRVQRIFYDLFDPTVLELRELYGIMPSLRQRAHLAAEWWRLSAALMMGDVLICAARKQRELYESMQGSSAPWIEVPFGIDLADVRVCARPAGDIVVWNGGVWEWLDPATAVDAIIRLNREGLQVKLLFLGRARPNRELIDRRRDDRFDALLERAGPHVSANDTWTPYRERLSWLRSGRIAIMLHRRTAEAEYSIRTRLFDAIAAGTPVVATAGGFAAELVGREGLGIVVPPGDVAAVADAIRQLLTDDQRYRGCVENLERIRPRFAWELVTRPLVRAIMGEQTDQTDQTDQWQT